MASRDNVHERTRLVESCTRRQDCFEKLSIDEPIPVILISIDIVHGDRGDMSKEENIDFWCAMFHSGKILGCFRNNFNGRKR